MTSFGTKELDAVRAEVRSLLEKTPAFRTLGADEKTKFANDMVKVGEFLADKDWIAKHKLPEASALATQPPPDAVGQLKQRLATDPGFAGEDFKAGAVQQGTEAFGELVKKVDFPKFVSGLIQGVFQAIVDASIQQMQAYGELLSATAKTVDQFASDHITDGMARDHVKSRFPNAVDIDTSGETARLRPRGEDVDIGKELGASGVDLSDDDGEQRVVMAAKMQMAQQRQQTLATMVLMGINRIVVTNGHINAKVVFDMRASDAAKRRSKAELHDSKSDKSAMAVGGTLAGIFGGAYAESHDHETTVGSSVDETSEAKAAVKAQLTGDVRLAFKSETFPLDRMVDVLGLENLNAKAAPVPTARPPAKPAAPALPAGGAK